MGTEVTVDATLQSPRLFSPLQSRLNPEAPPKYGATLILDQTNAGKVYTAIQQESQQLFGHTNAQHWLRSGAEKADREGAGFNASNWFVDAKNPRAPGVFVPDGNGQLIEVTASSQYANVFRPGCRVRAILDVWAQKAYGAKVNTHLVGILWLGEGPELATLGGGRSATAGDFGGTASAGGPDPAGVPQPPPGAGGGFPAPQVPQAPVPGQQPPPGAGGGFPAPQVPQAPVPGQQPPPGAGGGFPAPQVPGSPPSMPGAPLPRG